MPWWFSLIPYSCMPYCCQDIFTTHLKVFHVFFPAQCTMKFTIIISQIWGIMKMPFFILTSLNLGNFVVKYFNVGFVLSVALSKFFTKSSWYVRVATKYCWIYQVLDEECLLSLHCLTEKPVPLNGNLSHVFPIHKENWWMRVS